MRKVVWACVVCAAVALVAGVLVRGFSGTVGPVTPTTDTPVVRGITGTSTHPEVPAATDRSAQNAKPTTVIGAASSVADSPGGSVQSQDARQSSSALSFLRGAKPAYAVVRGREGFWRLGQTREGVWWFLPPGSVVGDWLNTVTTVQPFQLARDPNGAQYVSSDYDGGITENGNLRGWAEKSLVRVRDAGFKGLGAWSNTIFHELEFPMTRDLNLWKWVNGDKNTVLLYSPDFAKFVETGVKHQVVKLRNNRNLVGYFSDNELDWSDAVIGPRVYFDRLPPADPNRVQVSKVIRQMWAEPADFNREWGTTLVTWDDLDRLESLPLSFSGPGGRRGNYSAYVRLLSRWMEHLARDYFRLTTTLIRKYDENHLILGVRFKAWAPPEIVRGSREWTDAQSLNSYVGDARLDREMFTMMNRESGGQPVMITEYSFHSLDGRSGNRNTVGFSAQVLDQRARAEGYRLFTTRLARVPWVIGADWFQWADEPPSGRHFDGEDVNFGIVDIDDRAYDHMVSAVRKTAPLLNGLHARSVDDGIEGPPASSDVWRESYAVKPVQRVEYLTTAPQLNGELSDWPEAARMSGVRHSKTLGLERSRVPLPNIFCGWRDEGLYLAFEIFDDDIQGADPQGSWWTRDCLEWWISTREVPTEQNYFDGFCHQFFFVPHEFPVAGLSGTVGRWHRPGDAVEGNRVPDPNVRQATRIFPGRYVVEMLIQPAALAGWDPVNEPRIAFNMHVRNWQHAIDYFWSAPKELQTQVRPNTWGVWFLAPKR